MNFPFFIGYIAGFDERTLIVWFFFQFFHLLGFWLALVALVWTNETTHRRQFLPQLTGLVMSHVLLFLVRVVCEIYYVEYRYEKLPYVVMSLRVSKLIHICLVPTFILFAVCCFCFLSYHKTIAKVWDKG